jgi:hypothetical protein
VPVPEYALANRVQHPVNVYLRENLVIGEVDRWLAREFAPHRMSETLRALAEARQSEVLHADDDNGTAGKVAECDRKLAQYRAALDAGANPATVAAWIAETEAEKASYALVMRRSGGSYRGLVRRESGLVRPGCSPPGRTPGRLGDWATADSTVTTTAAVGSTNGTPPWVGHPVRHVGERVSGCGEFVENLQRVQGRGRLTERAAHIGLDCVPVPAIAAAIRRQGPQHRINRYVVLRDRHPVAIQQPG